MKLGKLNSDPKPGLFSVQCTKVGTFVRRSIVNLVRLISTYNVGTVKFEDCIRCGERVEYRMLMDSLYRGIVQNPYN